MPGIPREVIEHKLGLLAGVRPVRQKQRRYTPEKRAAIQDEINRLLKASFVWEVPFLEWLANPVMVRKPNGTWWMCKDYTDLNKACPKDEYPLPRIDQIVDSTSRWELLCFPDAYSGYHQISMCIDDEEKTAFVTPFGVYCYIKMPFGLKNVGSKYQKCVHIVL
jgi:hypothetical protein